MFNSMYKVLTLVIEWSLKDKMQSWLKFLFLNSAPLFWMGAGVVWSQDFGKDRSLIVVLEGRTLVWTLQHLACSQANHGRRHLLVTTHESQWLLNKNSFVI